MGSFSADRPVSFYVMSGTFAQGWFNTRYVNTGFCSPSGTSDQVLIAQREVTSFSIDFTINNPGGYEFVFVNSDPLNTVNINFNVGIVSS